MNDYMNVLRKYLVLRGRARRKELWMFILVNLLISVALSLIDALLGLRIFRDEGLLTTLYSAAVLLPSIAVGVRRLHDLDRSGWWLLLSLIPLLGSLLLLIYFCFRGTPGSNRFGSDPLALATE